MTSPCRDSTLAPGSETAAIIATVPNRPGRARGAEQRKQTTFPRLGHGDDRPRRTDEVSSPAYLGAPLTGDSSGRIPPPGVRGGIDDLVPGGSRPSDPKPQGDGILPGLGPRDGRADALSAEQEIVMNSRNGGVGIIGVIVIVVVILLIVGVIKI